MGNVREFGEALISDSATLQRFRPLVLDKAIAILVNRLGKGDKNILVVQLINLAAITATRQSGIVYSWDCPESVRPVQERLDA